MIGDYAASFLPFIMVPLVGLVTAAVAMGLFFQYVEADS
ncbi:photosystem I reaction center subunit VIII [Prochlorothrix hollandica]|jgi:photosystem I reaction center subunit VIII|uniref:Photosystem I reaction center subunit VIII n=1 Tax=Prochlorothrix hollandica PCC 9006 = CALU 1027 TaxID=317619 RepID=A0A0M2PTJ0_PROHO|nr:photosystem I reaction center subunit VIII [Prochlorothrix hollandica]KKI99805.1 Photosystem I reaction center subunit VIII [Prochlorothrix hollandica PCC 9006 = CALU 1027]